MTDIVWGSAIAVDGKRPEWLKDDERVSIKDYHDSDFYGDKLHSSQWNGYEVTSETQFIKLPASHFAYTAIAAGFVPWGGGDEAPADATGEVLFRNGNTDAWMPEYWRWTWTQNDSNIIGYRRRTEQPANAETVTIARMTEAEVYPRFERMTPMQTLRELGLIRELTEAERIAADTGIDLATVERVLAARA